MSPLWPVAMLFAAVLGVFAAELEARVSTPPGLVIVCEMGGVQSDISHIASGANCVLHDRSGSAASAGAISVYSDDGAVP